MPRVRRKPFQPIPNYRIPKHMVDDVEARFVEIFQSQHSEEDHWLTFDPEHKP